MLFLDEISELSPKLQAKLLRLIENRSFHRVGGEQAIPFKARLVCATNADSVTGCEGEFRDDLYYRINVLAPHVPPLREREDDIEWLIDRFFAEFARRYQSDAVGLSPSPTRSRAIIHGRATCASSGTEWSGRSRLTAAGGSCRRTCFPSASVPYRAEEFIASSVRGARRCREAAHSAGANNDRRCHPPRGEGARHFAYDAVGENEALWPSRFGRVKAMCGYPNAIVRVFENPNIGPH